MGPQSCPGGSSRKGLRGRLSVVVGDGLLAFQEGGHSGALDVNDSGVHHLTIDLHHHLIAQGGVVQALWERQKRYLFRIESSRLSPGLQVLEP